ncbi:hypothetical protein CJO81_07000 [Ralstonia solanacearum]|uniref:hypothetical protein n=1 Tax=Ralstonia pseudosolanacearum TaxID=1310165 RepID=UPI000E594C82|nr:hypothetical protein [Ralstonia pseudosolanacearum]AXW00535.1 hypothetical protein CJO81_07000 [Ralstonia solanacearum]AXW28026.1 hypothetical protein CJO87_07000 [Ralstonia solanacearum]UYR06183.1 hypothetical protein NQS38_14930 [Ralstonia pseudosolanacearum]
MMRAAAWYIDSIDARSGYAFASYRIADLSDAAALSDVCETVFIEAPHFVPERVGSRTLSLGATRTGFQTGLYVQSGEDEVPFPTLDALTDFVRRAYGSGGSSDGGSGTTPPVTPRSGDNGPRADSQRHDVSDGDDWKYETGRREAVDVDPVDALKTAYRAFAGLIQQASLTNPADATGAFDKLLESRFRQAEGRFAAHRLARAALRLSAHVISFPEPAEFSAERRILDASGRHLFACISRLNLWGSIRLHLQADAAALKQVFQVLSEFYDSRIGPDWLKRHFERAPSSEDASLLARLLQVVLGSGRQAPRLSFRYLNDRAWWHLTPDDHRVTESSNRFADLSHIMIPESLIPIDYRPEHVSPSLRNLLAFGCNAFAQIPAHDQDAVFETMLFAACYLNAPVAGDMVGTLRSGSWYGLADSEQEASLDALHLVATTLPWIRANLPNYAFVQEVENSIAQAAKVGR